MNTVALENERSVLTVKREREIGIDALKMFSMFLIVILHVLGQGGILSSSAFGSVKYHIAWIMEIGAYCAVNCYGMASGYVGIGSKNYKYSNIVYLWLQVLFYTVGITTIFYILKPEVVTGIRIRAAVFPLFFSQYWYFTAYFFVFLMMPALNLFVDKIPQKASKLFITLLVIITTVPPIFFERDPFSMANGYSAVWLMIMYLVGAYFKKYEVLKKVSAMKWSIIYISAVLLTWIFKTVFEENGFRIDFFISMNSMSLVNYLSPTIFLSGVALMGAFTKLKLKKTASKLILLITPFTFGVYLIHVHQLIWAEVENCLVFLVQKPTALMLCGILAAALAVFFVCVLIDAVREFIFKILHIKQFLMWLEKKLVGDIWKGYKG